MFNGYQLSDLLCPLSSPTGEVLTDISVVGGLLLSGLDAQLIHTGGAK